MNLAIITTLLKSFVENHEIELDGTNAQENYEIVLDVAQLEESEEILDFLQYIEKTKLKETFFKPQKS